VLPPGAKGLVVLQDFKNGEHGQGDKSGCHGWLLRVRRGGAPGQRRRPRDMGGYSGWHSAECSPATCRHERFLNVESGQSQTNVPPSSVTW